MASWSCEYVADAASGGTSSAPYLAALGRFAAASSSASARFVVFTSDAGADGRYWCPDCVTAIPAVKRAAQKAGVPLLEVGVGDRAAWRGNASHPFRAPPLSLTGVPTLVRLEGGGGGEQGTVAARLGPELERAGTPKAAEKLAAAFFAAE